MTDSPKLAGTLIHLSISMEFDNEPLVASGEYDHLIDELVAFVNEYSDRLFYIRIGYEFEGSWNHYEPEAFIKAWRRIVDKLRESGATNFATVMGSARRHVSREDIDKYYPGDEYVDWLGYSYWGETVPHPHMLDFAREKGKPVFIAETTPRGFDLAAQSDAEPLVWYDWYTNLFDHIEANLDVIKAVSYINTHWEAQPMWKRRAWGDARLQKAHPDILENWLEKMASPTYVHTPEGVNAVVGFTPKK